MGKCASVPADQDEINLLKPSYIDNTTTESKSDEKVHIISNVITNKIKPQFSSPVHQNGTITKSSDGKVPSKDMLKLVDGYLRGNIHNYERSLVNIIVRYVAVLHYERFDSKNIGKHHTFNENVITCNGLWSSSYFTNEISSGIHTWRFKIKSKKCDAIVLGIWKTNSGKPPLDDWFWDNDNGYGWWVGHAQDHNGNFYPRHHYGKFQENSIVEMILDMSRFELKYSVDGIDCGIMSNVENIQYKAAAFIGSKGQSVEFVSYTSCMIQKQHT